MNGAKLKGRERGLKTGQPAGGGIESRRDIRVTRYLKVITCQMYHW